MENVVLTVKVDPKTKDLLNLIARYTGLSRKEIVARAMLEFVRNNYPELLNEEARKIVEEKIKESINKAISPEEKEVEVIKNMLLTLISVIKETIKKEAMVIAHQEKKYEVTFSIKWLNNTLKKAYDKIKNKCLTYFITRRFTDGIKLITLLEHWFIWWGYWEYILWVPLIQEDLKKIYEEKGFSIKENTKKWLRFLDFNVGQYYYFSSSSSTSEEDYSVIHMAKINWTYRIVKKIIQTIEEEIKKGNLNYKSIENLANKVFEEEKEKMIQALRSIKISDSAEDE